jgi:hypothetical protein
MEMQNLETQWNRDSGEVCFFSISPVYSFLCVSKLVITISETVAGLNAEC